MSVGDGKIPKSLMYGDKRLALPSKAFRSRKTTTIGQNTFGLGGEVATIQIPTGNNLVMDTLDSFLKGTLVMTVGGTASTFRLGKAGFHGLIEKLTVRQGSQVWQFTEDYGLVSKMLNDLIVPINTLYGKRWFEGLDSDYVYQTTGATYPASTNVLVSYPNTGGALLGASTATNAIIDSATRGTFATTTVVSQPFVISLYSIVGLLNQGAYLPLFEMGSAPLEIEITWQSAINRMMAISSAVSTTAGANYIKSVEFVGTYCELTDEIVAMVRRRSSGPLTIPFTNFATQTRTFTLTQNTLVDLTWDLTCKYSSLRSIFIAIKDRYGTDGYFPQSCVHSGLTQYQFRIGNTYYPRDAVTTSREQFTELLKAIGSIGDAFTQPSITKRAYQLASSVAYVVESTTGINIVDEGAFFVGLDCEFYPGADKQDLLAGMNTISDVVTYNATYYNPSSNTSQRFVAVYAYDCNLRADNGVGYVEF